MMIIEQKSFDEERALYHLEDSEVRSCRFAGPADGESALKESHRITVSDCSFELRYPLWHCTNFTLTRCRMSETARAALWYNEAGVLEGCELGGIKALREGRNLSLRRCRILSQEFGWKCRDVSLTDSEVTAEYLFLDSRNVSLKNVKMKGKYSFQYMEDLTIEDSVLDTKDAFWHSKHVTVRNSTVKGEYLAWFSEDLTLDHCHIIGTQPLCYCKGLKLIDCTMEGCDLAFEYSEVEASVKGHIDSVKNPRLGTILCDSVGEVIMKDAAMPCIGRVQLR